MRITRKTSLSISGCLETVKKGLDAAKGYKEIIWHLNTRQRSEIRESANRRELPRVTNHCKMWNANIGIVCISSINSPELCLGFQEGFPILWSESSGILNKVNARRDYPRHPSREMNTERKASRGGGFPFLEKNARVRVLRGLISRFLYWRALNLGRKVRRFTVIPLASHAKI